MAKQQTPSRSAHRLLENGALEALPPIAGLGARDIVLSRALCRFRLYRAPSAVTVSQLANAARTYAELHAPFADPGVLILRAPEGAEIWYWDKSKLAAVPANARVSPESVWFEPGEGWRIVKCAEGHEAQYWQGDRLLASTWRRAPFTAAQWASFALSVDEPSSPAPDTPPPPAPQALVNRAWRLRVINRPLGWGDAEKVSVMAATCAAGVAALFAGQALTSEAIIRHEQAGIAALQSSMRENDDVVRTLGQRRLIHEYVEAVRHPAVLRAAVEAQEVLSRFGLRSSAWRANADGLTLIVDAPLAESPVREVVEAIEAAQHICDAEPEIANAGRFEVRATIAESDAQCGRTSDEAAP